MERPAFSLAYAELYLSCWVPQHERELENLASKASAPGEQLMPFVRIASQSELPPNNEAKEFPCGEKTICVANVNGTITAMDNVCLHRGGPLGQGTIEKGKVVCPWHGWAWDPATGQAAHNSNAKVAVYPLKIENGDVLIELG
jgi:nitrite reductase (NADH) small subunit